MLCIGKTSEQIRGHHKKMLEKYHSIDQILLNLSEKKAAREKKKVQLMGKNNIGDEKLREYLLER